ncbi:MAG: CDP-glycerol glycerophosphotransferase family protein [Erysipelotrichales bacterium]|nr:CDP-glycerol glycerophosphotransferase family protein [Erysipelotrichales bacterium]
MKNHLLNILNLFFSLFPIKRNQLLFIDYYGAKYGDSPAVLSEHIVETHPEWKIVWAFNNPGPFEISDVIKIRYMSVNFFWELNTSGIIITNYRMPEFFRKRKGQKYLQTWHSSLRLKKIEKDAQDNLPPHYIKMAQLDSKNIDLIISGSQMSSATFKNSFWYKGEVLECGTPRIDKLINISPNRLNDLKNLMDIKENERVILYCPTFRHHEEDKKYYLDPFLFYNMLHESSPNINWKVLIRYHPHESMGNHFVRETTKIKDVTPYSDVQDLISIADILVTDYSGVMFDFAYTSKPCFLFVPDLVQYIAKERELYFDINTLPFPVSSTYTELVDQIININREKYSWEIKKFLESVGSFEKGVACEKVTKKLEEWVKKKE